MAKGYLLIYINRSAPVNYDVQLTRSLMRCFGATLSYAGNENRVSVWSELGEQIILSREDFEKLYDTPVEVSYQWWTNNGEDVFFIVRDDREFLCICLDGMDNSDVNRLSECITAECGKEEFQQEVFTVFFTGHEEFSFEEWDRVVEQKASELGSSFLLIMPESMDMHWPNVKGLNGPLYDDYYRYLYKPHQT